MTLLSDLSMKGVLRGYDRHVLRLEPILVRMSERGIPVDPERFAEVEKELTQRQVASLRNMQQLIPDELRPFHPKDGYKRTPFDGYYPTTGEPYILRQFDDGNKRWVKLDEWVPSHKGLTMYCIEKGIPLPKDWKKGTVTFAEKELRRLVKKFPNTVFPFVLDHRDASTMLDNHMKNWRPGPDGRVHPTFYYDTSTGQLSSRRPNVQNAPHHKESQGPLFRSMVIAAPSHTFLAFDYHGFHVMTLAFEAKDAELMRIGRLDVHSFVTAHLLKLPDHERQWGWPDDQLAEYLRDVKKKHGAVRNAKVKHAFLGYDNGMGYRKLYNQYMEFFDSQSDAKKVMDLLDGLFPKSKVFREEICRQAHEQGYLLSRHGHIRYFSEVFKPEYHGTSIEWKHGEDMEAAKSYLTQNDAHGHLRDAMIRIDDAGWMERAKFENNVHDELFFECPDELIDEASCVIKAEMERPSEVLVNSVAPEGLTVSVEVKRGKIWNRMA